MKSLSSILPLVGIVVLAALLLRYAATGDRKRKYDRKPQSPWNALNNNEDPTL